METLFDVSDIIFYANIIALRAVYFIVTGLYPSGSKKKITDRILCCRTRRVKLQIVSSPLRDCFNFRTRPLGCTV